MAESGPINIVITSDAADDVSRRSRAADLARRFNEDLSALGAVKGKNRSTIEATMRGQGLRDAVVGDPVDRLQRQCDAEILSAMLGGACPGGGRIPQTVLAPHQGVCPVCGGPVGLLLANDVVAAHADPAKSLESSLRTLSPGLRVQLLRRLGASLRPWCGEAADYLESYNEDQGR